VSPRNVTIAGFVALALLAVALHLAGRRHRLGLVPLGDVVDVARSCTPARIALVLGWAWVGWHFLAR
jgi:hypothetical protein